MHYLKANSIDLAYNYFKKAGQDAQRNHCYVQALSLYQYALDNSESIKPSIYEVAKLHFIMGDIYYSQDNVVLASEKFIKVLNLLNYELPPLNSISLFISNFKLRHNSFKIYQKDLIYIKNQENDSAFINPLLLASSAYEKLINYFYDANYQQGRNMMLRSICLSKQLYCSAEYACAVIRYAQFLSMSDEGREESLQKIEESSEILTHVNNFEAKIYIQYYAALIQLSNGVLGKSLERINKLYWSAEFLKLNKMMKDTIVLRSIIYFFYGNTEAGIKDMKPYNNDLHGGGLLLYTLFQVFHGNYSCIITLSEKYGLDHDLSNIMIMKEVLESSKAIPIGILISVYNLKVLNQYETAFTIIKMIIRQKKKLISGLDVIDVLYIFLLAHVWWKCAVECYLEDEFYKKECVEVGINVLDLIQTYSKVFYIFRPMLLIISCLCHRLIGNTQKARNFLNEYTDFKLKIPLFEPYQYCELLVLDEFHNKVELKNKIMSLYKSVKVVQIQDYMSKTYNSYKRG